MIILIFHLKNCPIKPPKNLLGDQFCSMTIYEEQNNCFIYFVLFTKRSHVTHSVLLIICQTFVSNMTYLTIFDVLLGLFDERHICAKYFYKM